MLSHDRIWAAIDKLAEIHDLTPSGLAKRAGLDSTTFNKSKRFAADGRARWPSTESIAKIIDATGVSMADFTGLVAPAGTASRSNAAASRMMGLQEDAGQYTPPSYAPQSIPVVGMAQAGAGGFFDDAGFPAGEGWDAVDFPGAGDVTEHAYALEISGDSMLPLYRAGDRIIVVPGSTVRKGDRVVVRTRDGEVMAKILKRKSAKQIELASANPEHADRVLDPADVDWMARIVWASQ